MSLSASEQQALDSIKDGLASSDPTLVARLTMFARLASGEEMPAREKIHAGSRRAALRPASRVHHRLGLQGAALLLWLVTTIALIAVALVYSRDGSHDTCTGTLVRFCASGTSASGSAPGLP
ncbi:MAG: hypothetical protein ACRDOH_03950 [Streptosporangiaceae bacterium]